MDIKRSFDIAVSSASIVCLAVPVLSVAFTMSAVNRASPFFAQTRIGLNQRPFKLIKIKTMRDTVGSDGNPLPDEQRTTKFGVFLRRSHIDELPQLINVLRGEMSIVGPRPAPTYQQVTTSNRKRHEVRPGITGLAQISGANGLDTDQKLDLDEQYIDKRGFLFDLLIIAKTPLSIIRDYKQPHYNHNTQLSGLQAEKKHVPL